MALWAGGNGSISCSVLTLPPGCLVGFLKEGCELISEALNLFNNVYGAMHVEICACLRLLARLHYIMGDYAEVCRLWHWLSRLSWSCMEGLGTPPSPPC